MIDPSSSVVLWAAIAFAGFAFAGFAWLFADTLDEGTRQYAAAVGAETSRQFEEAFLFVTPARIARLGRLAACAAFFLFFIPLFSFANPASTLAGFALGLAAGAYVFTLPKRLVRLVRERRRLAFEGQLVDALGTMSNALRAGFSINQAFESVVETGEKPIAQEFGVLLQQLRVGMSFDEALASLDRRVGSDDLTLVCTAIDIARRTGGNVTEIFDRICETVRGRQRIERRVRTLTAQGRLQGLVVSAMPFVLGAALYVMKPALMKPFVFSVRGAALIAVAALLVAIGWLVIRRIVRIDV